MLDGIVGIVKGAGSGKREGIRAEGARGDGEGAMAKEPGAGGTCAENRCIKENLKI